MPRFGGPAGGGFNAFGTVRHHPAPVVPAGRVASQPDASVVFSDSVSGTSSVSGSVVESYGVVRSDSPSGTVVVSGGRTEALRHSLTATGTSTGTGSKVEGLRQGSTITGSSTATGSRTETVRHTATVTGTVTVTGSKVEAYGKLNTDTVTGTTSITGSRVGQHRHTDTRTGTVLVSGSAVSTSRLPGFAYQVTVADSLAVMVVVRSGRRTRVQASDTAPVLVTVGEDPSVCVYLQAELGVSVGLGSNLAAVNP